jgi:hypothetical protein
MAKKFKVDKTAKGYTLRGIDSKMQLLAARRKGRFERGESTVITRGGRHDNKIAAARHRACRGKVRLDD